MPIIGQLAPQSAFLPGANCRVRTEEEARVAHGVKFRADEDHHRHQCSQISSAIAVATEP